MSQRRRTDARITRFQFSLCVRLRSRWKFRESSRRVKSPKDQMTQGITKSLRVDRTMKRDEQNRLPITLVSFTEPTTCALANTHFIPSSSREKRRRKRRQNAMFFLARTRVDSLRRRESCHATTLHVQNSEASRVHRVLKRKSWRESRMGYACRTGVESRANRFAACIANGPCGGSEGQVGCEHACGRA